MCSPQSTNQESGTTLYEEPVFIILCLGNKTFMIFDKYSAVFVWFWEVSNVTQRKTWNTKHTKKILKRKKD